MREVWTFSGTLHYGELWGPNNGSSWCGTQAFTALTSLFLLVTKLPHSLLRFALMGFFCADLHDVLPPKQVTCTKIQILTIIVDSTFKFHTVSYTSCFWSDSLVMEKQKYSHLLLLPIFVSFLPILEDEQP